MCHHGDELLPCPAGWCIFNDLAVAGKAAQRDAGIGQVLMIDLDVHQGDGSATIFAGGLQQLWPATSLDTVVSCWLFLPAYSVT
jgi:acetoin utilization deacetylase AcuC-like enzyme